MTGRVERIGETASDGLCPRPAAARAGRRRVVQSTVVDSWEELADEVRLLDEQSPPGPLPRPKVWGGYRVIGEGGVLAGRRRPAARPLRFVRDDDEGGGWIVQRLAP